MKKQGNEVAIRRDVSLAAQAWSRLETAATEAMKPNGSPPALQLVADTAGITALVTDEFGTRVMIQKGRISVNVAPEANG
jgi:hypothetical protein